MSVTTEQPPDRWAWSFVRHRVYLLQFKSDCVTKMAFNVRYHSSIVLLQKRSEKVCIIPSSNTVYFLSVYTARIPLSFSLPLYI